MARKTTRTTRKAPVKNLDAAQAFALAKSSAQKAVDAGLVAATSVRQSAVGAFDALVKQGAALESAGRKAVVTQLRKTRKAAIAKATDAREAAVATATEARTRTVDAVSQLEKVFEQRVSRAISKLGVPTQKDVRALSRQVAQLQASVDGLRRTRARRTAA